MSSEIGVIGLSVMGQGIALNIASRGIRTSCWNRTTSKTWDCVNRGKELGNYPVFGFEDFKDFIASLSRPRKVWIMVQAGAPVDAVLDSLLPHLSEGDLVIDGGNEFFSNTQRRVDRLAALGIHFLGIGVSGGEEGALHGPSLMPGGSEKGYSMVKTILEKIAAEGVGGPCVAYMGNGGAGNYVKMVHNGIEYGDMQLIAESYLLLKSLGLSNEKIALTFDNWNKGALKSYLTEITAEILRFADPEADKKSGEILLDKILDVAGSKGTGKWTVQQAAELGVPCPTIAAALDCRYLSTSRAVRLRLHGFYEKFALQQRTEMLKNLSEEDKSDLINAINDALYCSKVACYSQGLHLLHVASKTYNWGLNLASVAQVWTGGCIIRANILAHVRTAIEKLPQEFTSLLIADSTHFVPQFESKYHSWRKAVLAAVQLAVPIPALAASLSYFDSFACDRLPTTLIQAQRDFFGAHEFQRTDRPGSVHAHWGSSDCQKK